MKKKKYTEYMGFRLSADEKQKYKAFAKTKKWSMGKLIRVAIYSYLVAEGGE